MLNNSESTSRQSFEAFLNFAQVAFRHFDGDDALRLVGQYAQNNGFDFFKPLPSVEGGKGFAEYGKA
jgi:hypothetical protein